MCYTLGPASRAEERALLFDSDRTHHRKRLAEFISCRGNSAEENALSFMCYTFGPC